MALQRWPIGPVTIQAWSCSATGRRRTRRQATGARLAPLMSAVQCRRREDQDDRAPGLARARGGGGPDRGSRARGEDRRERARPRHARARIPQRQGAAGGRAAPGRPRGRARRGRAPRAAGRGTRRRSPTPGSRRSATRSWTCPTCPRRARRSRSRSRWAWSRRRKLGDYRGVEVGRREPKVDDEEVQAELERLRESLASLETVDRAAGEGDYVVMDYVGSRGRRAVRGRRGPRPGRRSSARAG